MKRLFGLLLALTSLLVVILGLAAMGAAAQAPAPVGDGLRLLDSTPQAIVLEYRLPGYSLEQELHDGQAYDLLRVDGAGLSVDSGRPQLPVRGLMVGIPPGARVSIEVLELEDRSLPGAYYIPPVPAVRPAEADLLAGPDLDPAWEGAEPGAAVWLEDPKVYGADALYPSAAVELVESGAIRSQGVALLRLDLAQYNPVSGSLRLVDRVKFRLVLAGASPSAAWSSEPEEESFERLLARALVNYDSARAWRAPRADAPPPDAPSVGSRAPSAGEWYRIAVDQTGLYKLSYEDLGAAGLPVATLDPDQLQVYYRGAEVAIWVELGPDGTFDPGDYLLFYGQDYDDKYTGRNIYWLAYDQGTGLRMEPLDGTPPGGYPVPECFTNDLHAEVNSYRVALVPIPDIDYDRWMWANASAGGVIATTSPLGHICPTGTVTVTSFLFGYNDDPGAVLDHHVELWVNGTATEDTWWAGRTVNVADFHLSQALLQDGDNDFDFNTLAIPGVTSSVTQMDWYDIRYRHAYLADADRLIFGADTAGAWEFQVGEFSTGTLELYDVSDPYNVVRYTDFLTAFNGLTYTLRFSGTVASTDTTRYLAQAPDERLQPLEIVEDAPSSLRDLANGADWIAISHAAFMTEAQRLADLRTAGGLRAMAVDLQDVYDEFNYGRANIHAVEDFLLYAYQYWQPPAPAYVVIVGDGSYDLKDYKGLAPDKVTYFPPYLAPVDIQADAPRWEIPGEVAANNRYVCLVGGDIFPDMHIGILPANSPESAAAMVDKIEAYESASYADWMSKILIVSDNPDSGGPFYELSDDMIDNHLPVPPYTADKVYVGQTCFDGPGCRTQIMAGYDAGHLLLNYIGHAGVAFWAHEQIFQVSDVPGLNNPNTLPVNLAMACSDGAYDKYVIGYECLAEVVLREPAKGAIASWSGTGTGLAAGHHPLNTGFFDAVFYDGVRELGPATYYGKLRLWNESGANLELVDLFLLFGDPATAMRALDTDLQVGKSVQFAGDEPLPGDILTYTLDFTNTGPGLAHGVILSDILPPGLVDPVVVYSSTEVLSQQIGLTFTWNITDLLPGEGGQIVLRVSVDPGLAGALDIDNVARITSRTPDLVPANNVSTATVQVAIPWRFIYLPLVLRDFVP